MDLLRLLAITCLVACSHPHGPNESAAPASVDRRPQPPDPLGMITSGAACHVDSDCSPTESCFAPDFSPRGGHRPECDHDADCSSRGDGWVCNGSSCGPGCKNDAACSEGLECRHGHCSSYRCTDARAERCPQNHRCADSGDCKRMTCTADAQCDTGVCWSGSCYAQGGHCADKDMCCPP